MRLNLDEIEVQIEGHVIPGHPGWNEPPEGPEVQLDYVWLVQKESQKRRAIDILPFLSMSNIEIIEEAMLEEFLC